MTSKTFIMRFNNCLIFLCSVTVILGQDLGPGEPFKSWDLECNENHFVGGFAFKQVGNDHELRIFCRKVAYRQDAAVVSFILLYYLVLLMSLIYSII